jgi:MFS family permease
MKKDVGWLPTIVAVTFALFTDGFLYGVVIPLAPHSPAHITSDWMLGLLYAGYAVGVVAATPLFGVLSDRIGRRRPMLWGVATQAAAILLFLVGSSLPLLMLARIAQGAAAAATWTAGLAILAERFQKNRAQMMGVGMMGNTIGLVAGPLAGGLLFRWHGYRMAFGLALVLIALDAALRWLFVKDAGAIAVARTGFRVLLRNRTVQASSLVVMLGAWAWSVLEPLFPGHLEKTAQTSPAQVGLLFTIASLVYAFSCPWVGALADRRGNWPVMLVGMIAMAVSVPTLALAGNVVVAGVLLALVSVGYGLTMNPTLSELGAAVDSGEGGYGSVYAVYNVAYSVGMATSNVLAGIMASAFSLRVALVVTGAVMLCCVPATWMLRPLVAAPRALGAAAEGS